MSSTRAAARDDFDSLFSILKMFSLNSKDNKYKNGQKPFQDFALSKQRQKSSPVIPLAMYRESCLGFNS